MNLYFVTCQFDGVWRNFAYWAECADDATNQAIYDGATGASTCPTPAEPSYASQYHGPDFDGRKAFWVIPLDGGEPFGIAADTVLDAYEFAKECIGTDRFCMEWPTDFEASELLEPGWNQ